LNGLATAQIAALTTGQVAALTAGQLASLNLDAIGALTTDQIAAIAKSTGITPGGVAGAGNSCAARIALEGKMDKDKLKLLIAGQLELDKKALGVVGNDGAPKLRRDMNYLAGFR